MTDATNPPSTPRAKTKKTTTKRTSKKATKKAVKKTPVKRVRKVAKKKTKIAAKKTVKKTTKSKPGSVDESPGAPGFFPKPESWEPKTREDINRVAKMLLGVEFPGKRVCPHHNSPLDYLEQSFLQQKDLLIWANRGGGKTMLAAAATLFDVLFRGPIKIRVLGGSFDQSDRLAEYIREFIHLRPDLLAAPMRRDRVLLTGGSEIRMLAQSQRAVRGQHVQKIRCDEVDLFDSDVWQAVQFATRSTPRARGSIEVFSTLHRPSGLMHQLVQEARENLGVQIVEADPSKVDSHNAGYHLVTWCLWEVIERCPDRRKCADCLLAEDCRGIAKKTNGFFRIDDAIAIKARSSRAAWEAEMLCRGPQRQWLVFEEFDPAIHVRPVEYCSEFPLFRA
ncbi:MAG: hypothetical protein KAR11_03700, partial [Phycisphaerae bacterium]|nr:hypothetical protein [Phycisphaerae bacterium]